MSAQEQWVRICSSCDIYINKNFKQLKQLSRGNVAQQDRCDVQDRTWGSEGEKLMWPSEKEACGYSCGTTGESGDKNTQCD